eukprot:49141_1
MASCDQFGLWLSNRGILNALNSNDLLTHQKTIFEIFGGIKSIIETCLLQSDNITLSQHQQLFHLLSDIHKDKNKSKLNTNNDTQPMQSLAINDISMCNIFTFLFADDHQSLQQTCRQFAVIGRYKESYIIDPSSKLYSYFGQHLALIHKLEYITRELYSKDPEKQINVLQVMQEYIDDNVEKNQMIIVKTGIIYKLIEWFISKSTNTKLF